VAFQLACAAYLQLIEWAPLFPWNDLRHGNKQETLDIVLLILQVGVAVSFALRRRWIMAAGLAGYAAWFVLQLESWWRPYLFGGRTVGPGWYFARTYKILPKIGDRPTPDAAHMLLQLFLVLVLLSGGWALWKAKSVKRIVEEGPRTGPSAPMGLS
jgi:hypothetical protein